MLDSDQIPATKPPLRRDRDTENPPPTSCKRIKFDDDVILRRVVKDDVTPDLKVVECVEDDVISEISSTESSASSKKKKNSSPSNEATSRRQPSPSAAVTAPSSEEIDEFFKQAETYQHKLFVEKYNFDIVKDVPVEGRYEWVKLK